MSSVKQRHRDISPVTLQVVGGAVISSLYCGEVEGLSGEAGGLVESFLVELYRCKLCQFTCGLKPAISSHLLHRHRPPALGYLGDTEGGDQTGLQQGASSYQLELSGQSKPSDEDEDFLLYNMLDNMSPPSCDISTEAGLQVAHNCEVRTLFEEEDGEEEEDGVDSIFSLQGGSVDLSCPITPPATKEEMAQSAHLLTLGLCRISAARHPPPPSPTQHLLPPERPPAASQADRKHRKTSGRQIRTQLPCLLCPVMLSSRRLLDVHIRSHRAGGGFSCVRCSWTASSWNDLEPHWKSNCRKKRREEDEVDKEPKAALSCPVCLRTFRSVASQKAHRHGNCSDRWKSRLIGEAGGEAAEVLDRHTPGSQSETNQSVMVPGPTGSLQSTAHSKTKKTRRKKKKEEEREDAPDMGFCCSLCHRKFSSKLTLRRHLGVHGGERPFTCPHCSYSSRLRASLLQHLRTHTGEKPYRCGQCSYASIDRSSLVRHSRTHSQEKPHRCSHCDYSSIQKKSLDLHARRHHTVLLCASLASSFVEELDDSFMETRGDDDIWLIKFYAPWCSFCKQLDPVWHQIGSELKSLGSPVSVGRTDATANTGLAEEFRVRGYPAIIMWKKNMKYVYSGKRTKEEIMEFTHRVSGPLVRSLNSLQLFQHAMSRHDVMFVYVGATSQLKGNFSAAAEHLIVHTNFFSAARDVLPKVVTLTSLPAVVLFKDGTYFIYSEERDGELRSWINRERFPNFSKIDSYTLYAMGETGKLVSLVLLEEKNLCEKGVRYKVLMEKVAADYRDIYSRNFYFGFMEENDYISGLIMTDVIMPSFVVVNLSNDGYFLPQGTVDTEDQLFDFLNGILDGSIQCQGGNGVVQRIRRLVYDIKLLLTLLFGQAPLLGFILLSFPFAIATIFCYLCCKARPASSEDEVDVTDKKSD